MRDSAKDEPERKRNSKRVKGNVRSRVRESVIFAVYRKKINKIVFVLINCKAPQLLLKFNIILKQISRPLRIRDSRPYQHFFKASKTSKKSCGGSLEKSKLSPVLGWVNPMVLA